MSNAHTITKSIVRCGRAPVWRARCSCGFKTDAPRMCAQARRKLDRLVEQHLSKQAREGAQQATAP